MTHKYRQLALWSLLVVVALSGCGQRPTPTPTLPPDPSLTPVATRSASRSQAITNTPPPAPNLPPTGTPEPTSPPAPAFIQHTVRPGEALLGLAMDYGVSMASIQLANDLGETTDLIAGQNLLIPSNTQWPDERPFWLVHVVKSGETLIGIAAAYDLTVDDILRVNAITDPALIHPQHPLVLPLAQLVTRDAPQPTATAAPAVAAAPSPTETVAPTVEAAESAPTATPPAPTLPPPDLPAGPAEWSSYILTRINQARAEHGLNTLTIAPELTYAAQAHAEDCAQRGWGSHVGSDGAVLKTRLERAGYFGSNWGENWVQAQDAGHAFDWWYGEIPPNDPHRRNILSPYYTEIGIGIAQTGWGYIFVTDFGRR